MIQWNKLKFPFKLNGYFLYEIKKIKIFKRNKTKRDCVRKTNREVENNVSKCTWGTMRTLCLWSICFSYIPSSLPSSLFAVKPLKFLATFFCVLPISPFVFRWDRSILFACKGCKKTDECYFEMGGKGGGSASRCVHFPICICGLAVERARKRGREESIACKWCLFKGLRGVHIDLVILKTTNARQKKIT